MMKLGMQVSLGPGYMVLNGDPGPPPSKGHSPHFSALICCGQMAWWTKMPLGRKVNVNIVLDGDPAPPPQKSGQSPTILGRYLLCQTAG